MVKRRMGEAVADPSLRERVKKVLSIAREREQRRTVEVIRYNSLKTEETLLWHFYGRSVQSLCFLRARWTGRGS